MHGLPPRDFPKAEPAELFGLHARLGGSSPGDRSELARRYEDLDGRVRAWPRTAENDPFYSGSQALAARLGRETGLPVLVGFNEFCAPGLDEALDRAAGAAADVVVLTPMMTAGGDHAEIDIPAAIERARSRHPDVHFVYAWPFEVPEVARFLGKHVRRFLPEA
jgi:sirohydrochlorin cobaltochelatase